MISRLAVALSLFVCIAAQAQPSTPVPTLVIPASGSCTDRLAANSASSWFATLDRDGTICIWNVSNGHYLARTQAKGVQALAVLPHSHLAIEGDSDGNVRLADFDSFAQKASAKLDGSVLWLQSTADGRVFVITSHALYRLDPATLAATRLVSMDNKFFFGTAATDENGSAVGVAMHSIDRESDEAVVYDAGDGKVLFQKPLPRIESLALGGGQIAIGSKDSINIGDHSGHILVARIAGGTIEQDIAVSYIPWSLTFRQSGQDSGRAADLFAGFSGGIERISVAAGKTTQMEGLNANVDQLAYAGPLLVAGMAGSPGLCDTETLRCATFPVVQGVGVRQAKVLPDGSLLLMDVKGNALRIGEDIETSRVLLSAPLALIPEFKGMAGLFATDGNEVNSALVPVTPSDFISIPNGIPIAVSGNGQYLAARSSAPRGKQVTVGIYSLAKMSAGVLSSPPEAASWTLTSEQQNGFDAASEFQFGFTPDGRLLIAVNTQTGSIHRFEITSGRELLPPLSPPGPQDQYVIGDDFVSAWAVAPDGGQLVRAQFHSVRRIPLDGGAATGIVRVGSDVTGIAAGSDGSWFLALGDGNILRWDGSGAPAPLAKLSSPATSLLYLPGRNWLIANLADGCIRVIDGTGGQTEMSLFVFANGHDWLAWTPGGLFDASDNGWEAMAWKFAPDTFSPSEPVEDFRDDFYSPGLAAAVLAGNPPPPPVLRAKERRMPTVALTASASSPAGKADLDITVTAPVGVAIRDVHLARNGVLLKTWAGTQQSGTRLAFTADVMAGKNRFTAYAFNQDGVKSIDGEADVTGPASLKRAGELYIVAVGIDDYRNPAFHLNYARHDARLAAAALAEQRKDIQTTGRQIQAQNVANGNTGDVMVPMLNGPPTDLLPSMGDAHVTTLIDAEATHERILKTISEVAHQARPEDTLIVFYAGHGVALGDRYYLLPQDFAFDGAPSDLLRNGRAALEHSAISDLDLQTAMAGEQAAVSALILDSCQSGELVGDSLAQRRGPMDSRGLAQMAYDKGMFILAASLSTQSAAEQAALGDGVLTYALMQEGLIDDMASPEIVPGLNANSHGPESLVEWLRWSANRVTQSADDSGNPRGFLRDEKNLDAAWLPVQQPRLFSPPGSGGDTIVALRPIDFDPKTMTAAGFTQPAPAKANISPPPISATQSRPQLLFPASTLGVMIPGAILNNGRQMLAAQSNRILGLDLDYGAVLWRQPVGGDIVAFDASPSGKFAVLDQSGNVSIVDRSATPAVKIIVPGYGFNLNGLVRFINNGKQLLVVTDSSIALYNSDGSKVRSIQLPGVGAHAPLLAVPGGWLYLGDSSGRVLSYKVPSLAAGPVLPSASANMLTTPGQFKYVRSLVVDPAGRHLIRIMSDGSFTEADLPSLAISAPQLIHARLIKTATFSADGSTLFVADAQGSIDAIRTADGAVARSWPAELAAVDTLTAGAHGTVLVATGNGGMAAWDTGSGKLRSLVPGGPRYTAAAFTPSGTIDLMVAGGNQVRAIQLPQPALTSSIHSSTGLFISHDRIVAKSAGELVLWDRADLAEAKQLPLAGDGRLDLTPDGRFFAWIPSRPTSPAIEVRETSTAHLLKSVSLAQPASAFALSPDGNLLVYLAGEQLHRIPLDGGPEAVATVPHAPCCLAAVASGNQRLLLASGLTGQVMLYDLAELRVIRAIETAYQIATEEFAGKSGQIVLAARNGSVLLWNPSSTEEPRVIGSVDGTPLGIAVSPNGTLALVTTDLGAMGWFSLAGAGAQIAATHWIESAQSWLTQTADGRLEIAGDSALLLGQPQPGQEQWKQAAQQPGYAPNLLRELLATR